MKIIAISVADYDVYGCPFCNCEAAHNTGIYGNGTVPVKCFECSKEFVVLANELQKSRIGFSGYYPELIEHPRKNKKHTYKKPDIKPEYGEFFRPRGVGYDLSGFVETKESGERILKMFDEILGRKTDISNRNRTYLDYRERTPNWIQVKVQKEDVNLEKLNELTQDGIITKEKILQCIN